MYIPVQSRINSYLFFSLTYPKNHLE
ncbi:hypothetical protein F383_15085 [Gossypium arboreum]|uniref:Uncharacterized protein n=1 Tax=Gossypium arboreum TaxID=29729 RepID=A0A0B0PTN5_GOSAR|nr:hypothetical protein F383_15085 [Gossypium arboreum]